MKYSRLIGFSLFFVVLALAAQGQEAVPLLEAGYDPNELRIRDRYVQVLERNPFQDRAFDSVYEAYFAMEGVDRWIEELEGRGEDSPTRDADLVLLGRIHARQFKVKEAIVALEAARKRGAQGAQFDMLLGTLYYDSGQYDGAAELLTRSLESLEDAKMRGNIARMLGNVYLRQGDRAQAIAAWQRIAEQDADDMFAVLELAGIYEENGMWQEAIGAHERVIEASARDAYRRCQSLRTIARALIQLQEYPQAIAKYEEAIELVSPGNWLSDELRRNLVTVYQDLGDLDGLLAYLEGKIERDPGAIDYRSMLADAYVRMNRYAAADAALHDILERAPANGPAYEKLIDLYEKNGDRPRLIEVYETLVGLFPAEPDFIRRFGEAHWRDDELEVAKETWSRWAQDESPERLAQVAKWYERYDLPEEAAETYAKALKGKRVPDWSLRLAALRYQLGAEDEALATWLSILDGGSSSAAQHAEVAAVLVSHGYLDEAERLYVAAAEKDPANLDYSLKLADLFMSQERFEEALAYHTALAEQDGLEYFRRKGESGQLEAYSALGRIPQVQAEWEAAVEADPESVEAALRVARLYDHVGNRSGAIGIYEKMAGLEPENPSHLVSLTLLYAAARQTGKTIVAYQTLIGIDRNRAASYHRELMRIYQGQNRREEATRSAEQVVALSPASAEARVTLAEIYLMYGRSEEALQQHRSALRLEPEDPSYLRKYGVALASDERWGEAAEAYRKMLAIARGEQTRLDAVQLLASVYLQQGRGQDLAREFSGRVLNTPKRLSAYEELATVYRAIGDLPRAVESIERAIEASEDKETVLRKLLAEAYNAGQLDKVVTAYTQLIDLSGRPTVFELERLGSVYAELGDLRMAQETWERIAEDYPDDPQALVTLANAFRSEGFIEEALGAKERAVELEPYDYPLRFELANDWFAHGEAGKGLAHLERIVELGAPPDEDGESHELSPDMLGLVMGSGRESQSAWNGTFAEFRPRVLTAMVSFGRRGGTIDELFERYRERANARAWDLNLKEDLLDMYEAANRWADAAEVAEELVAARPTDADLLIRTATLYQRSQDLVKAVETMGLLAEARPEEAASQQALLIRMYLTNGDMAKAKERIKALVEDRQDNSSVLLQAAGMLRKTGSPDQVEELYEYIVALDPSLTRRIQMRLVRLYRDKADLDAARRLYGEIIFASERDPNARRRQQEQGFVYTPDVQRGYWDHNITAILGRVNADVDLSRAQAFTDLMSMSLDLKPINTIVERLEALAEQYTQLEPGDEKRYTMEMAKILLAYYTCNEKFEKSLRLLHSLREGGGDEDEDLLNFALLSCEHTEAFSSMLPLYDDLEKLHPDLAEKIRRARLNVHILADEFEEASEIIRRTSSRRGGALSAWQNAAAES